MSNPRLVVVEKPWSRGIANVVEADDRHLDRSSADGVAAWRVDRFREIPANTVPHTSATMPYSPMVAAAVAPNAPAAIPAAIAKSRIEIVSITGTATVRSAPRQRIRPSVRPSAADDFVESPFSMPEMMARVRVALRHRRKVSMPFDDSVLVIGDLRIDPSGHAAAIGKRVLALTPKEYQLLALLAKHGNRVVAHDTILGAIWPNSKSFDTLRLHVSQLRKKLKQSADAPTIVTEPGVGYRLSDRSQNTARSPD